MRIAMAMLLAAGVSMSDAKVIQLRAPGNEGQTLALHCVEPVKGSNEAVLFIHGLSFPTMLAAGFEFEGRDSWLDFMSNRGFLACGLDFLGFGESSRPAAMMVEPAGAALWTGLRTPRCKSPSRQITCSRRVVLSACMSSLIPGARCPPRFTRPHILQD